MLDTATRPMVFPDKLRNDVDAEISINFRLCKPQCGSQLAAARPLCLAGKLAAPRGQATKNRLWIMLFRPAPHHPKRQGNRSVFRVGDRTIQHYHDNLIIVSIPASTEERTLQSSRHLNLLMMEPRKSRYLPRTIILELPAPCGRSEDSRRRSVRVRQIPSHANLQLKNRLLHDTTIRTVEGTPSAQSHPRPTCLPHEPSPRRPRASRNDRDS